MKVLLLGDYSTAMFVLSNTPGYIINMIPKCLDNTVKSIEVYLDLCKTREYNDAILIYNDTPWSHLIVSNENEETKRVKSKIYNLSGWKPDIIIYVYLPGVDMNINQSCLQYHNIPIFSTSAKETNLLCNLISIIIEYQKKS